MTKLCLFNPGRAVLAAAALRGHARKTWPGLSLPRRTSGVDMLAGSPTRLHHVAACGLKAAAFKNHHPRAAACTTEASRAFIA